MGREDRERDSKDDIKLILSSCLLYVRHHESPYGQGRVIHIHRGQEHDLVETMLLTKGHTRKWQSGESSSSWLSSVTPEPSPTFPKGGEERA